MSDTCETKACPYCGEQILAIAVKCKHCHSDLSTPTNPSMQSAAVASPPGTSAQDIRFFNVYTRI